jgi:hypothetical protein
MPRPARNDLPARRGAAGRVREGTAPPPLIAARPILGLLAAALGVATLVAGGRVLFGGEAARLAAGQVVPFVLWGNFLAGFAYLAAAAGVALGRRWGAGLAAALALGTAALLIAFAVHALGGGRFEPRTPAALVFRTGAWAVIALVARRPARPARGPGRAR